MQKTFSIMWKICFSLILLSFAQFGRSQEVRFEVEINSQRISDVDPSLVQQLEQNVSEFINSKVWTGDKYKEEERIEGSILIVLNERLTQNTYSGDLQIITRRPVYNSTYTSNLISFKDQSFQFEFSQFANLQFSENQFLSNLTSVMAFYVFITLAWDYDSYSLNGGTPFLRRAIDVVNAAQSSDFTGWRSDEKGEKNRYWIAENHMNSRFEGFRKCLYEYHRKGLDLMESNPVEARKNILSALEELRSVFQYRPNNINLRIFFNAKNLELVKMFSQAERDEKQKAFELLSSIDPANTNKYREILSGP